MKLILGGMALMVMLLSGCGWSQPPQGGFVPGGPAEINEQMVRARLNCDYGPLFNHTTQQDLNLWNSYSQEMRDEMLEDDCADMRETTLTRYETTSEEISGDSATVHLQMCFRHQGETEEDCDEYGPRYIKEGGQWKNMEFPFRRA